MRAIVAALAVTLLTLAAGCEATVLPFDPGCTATQTSCDGVRCVDLSSDPLHCGACGAICDGLEECRAGACVCPEGLTPCDGRCVELGTASHCGDCGIGCPTDERLCVEGACTACGGHLEPCCEAGACRIGSDVCVDGTCVSCGLDGQHCCEDGTCATGFSCTSAGRCGECGAPGQACCAGAICEGPIVNTCAADRCLQRSCEAFATIGFGEGWALAGRCSAETWECVHGASPARVCIVGDDTPAHDGFRCAECVAHQWLNCSVEHGCGREASELLCCWAAHCPEARYPCGECDDQNSALSACNLRDPSGSYCDRFYAGGAIARCF